MNPEQMRERAAILEQHADIKARAQLIRQNLADGRAGAWARMGYDAEQIQRCIDDAGRRLTELDDERRKLPKLSKRKRS